MQEFKLNKSLFEFSIQKVKKKNFFFLIKLYFNFSALNQSHRMG